MQVPFREFDPGRFSFHEDPVLILEDFWSAQELTRWQEVMTRQAWRRLSEMPDVARAFPQAGDWAKASIAATEIAVLMNRLTLPCIADYIESFPDIRRRHLSFNYYSYGAGDCLPTHDDTDDAYALPGTPRPARRLALVTYFHETWKSDWGGELLIYDDPSREGGLPQLRPSHCVAPHPGSLVVFTVPRYHRVARVDPIAGANRRLSIAGWFMTEH